MSDEEDGGLLAFDKVSYYMLMSVLVVNLDGERLLDLL